ncbi:MAG: outer membrane protein assembly factor BamD [Arenicella sp.]|jgi:outer membrane protein assembly factor BamD
MKHLLIKFIVAIVLLTGIGSCSDYAKVLKSGTNEAKRDSALMYYQKEEYIKTVTLLEDVIPYFKLTPSGETLYYTYCMANYKLGDYYLSGYYWKRFINQYPTSKHVEEATFHSALCAVNNSPEYRLDQTETLNALDELQIFIDLYPESNRIDSCNQIMDRLNGKLELKQYENAKLYHKTEQYQAAAVAFEGTIEKYPNSIYKEEMLFLGVESNYLLAINSIESKKLERLQGTLKSYRTFVAAFPESAWLAAAESIKSKTEKEIKNKTGNPEE